MKAVIMAGGEGTRLRPLTCDLPKPMTRLCGRPVMTYLLDLLQRHGVREAAVTMRYLPQVIREEYDGHYKDVQLHFVEEDKPLGTAGSVRGACRSCAGFEEDDILVVSGDALTDIDIEAAYAFHKRSGAAATLVVSRVEDPREYGLVDMAEDGRITGFVEKPGWAQAVTDSANTGMYILSPDILPYIPENTSFDFARDLFPLLLKDGLPLYAYETDSYWCDIGDLSSYVSCQKDILEGRVHTELAIQDGVVCADDERPSGSYTLVPPVYIGRGVRIGTAAQIGPFAVLDEGSCIGNNAKIRGSVLLEHAYVGDRASLTGALLCHGASVRRGASLFEGAVVGEGSVVGEYASVSPDVKIWPGKQVESSRYLRENLRDGHGAPSRFDDNGITGETGVELTPEMCARLGAAVGSLHRGEKVAVGCSHDRAATVLRMALISGILSAGGLVWDFAGCIEPQFDYFVDFSMIRMGVYVSGGPRGSIRLVTTGGLPAGRSVERAVETRLSAGDFTRASWDTLQLPTDMSGMGQLYRQELVSMAPEGLGGINAEVRGSDHEPVKMLSAVLDTVGCSVGDGIRLHLGAGGRRLSLFDPQAGYIWPERVLAISCYIAFTRHEDVALPYDAPVAIEEMAAKHGCRVRRYMRCPTDGADEEARRLAMSQPWVRDGLMTAVRVLDFMKRQHMTLNELTAELPSFAVATKTVPCDVNPGGLAQTNVVTAILGL